MPTFDDTIAGVGDIRQKKRVAESKPTIVIEWLDMTGQDASELNSLKYHGIKVLCRRLWDLKKLQAAFFLIL